MKTKRKVINIYSLVGEFAEDKDIARKIRVDMIWPAYLENLEIEIDFDRVTDATQSFIHAMISDLIRETQGEILDKVFFKNCSETVKKIISMVVDYMLDG